MTIQSSRFKIKPAFNLIWVIEFNDLSRTTVLHDKSFNVAKNPKRDAYQRGLNGLKIL